MAMAHIPKEKRDKWDAKSKELLFVGYNEDIKGYRLMDPRMYKIINSRDVVFTENKFLNNEDNQERNELQTILTSDKSDDEDESPHTSNSLIKEESEDDEFHESSDGMSTPKTTTETGLTNEPGPRRSNRTWKPVVKEGYISYLTVEEKNEDPITMDEALKSRQREHWIQAINREFNSLDENDT